MCSTTHRFRFFIDDAFAADGFTSYNQLNLGVTLNVAAGVHQLRIAKMNDGSKGEALIQSITLSQGGRWAHLPAPSPPRHVRLLTLLRKIGRMDPRAIFEQFLLVNLLYTAAAFHDMFPRILSALIGELSAHCRFLPPSPPSMVTSSRKILFLGDSYSVGYGNAGAVLPDTCKPTVAQLRPEWSQTCTGLKINAASECADLWQVLNQNSLAAFTAVTAQAFGADYQVIAASGKAVAQSRPQRTCCPAMSSATASNGSLQCRVLQLPMGVSPSLQIPLLLKTILTSVNMPMGSNQEAQNAVSFFFTSEGDH